jgi:ribosomal protein S18 acetylase RimI-like enzyme
MRIREAEEEDAVNIEKLAKECSPLRASIHGTYEYLALCFRRYFLVVEEEEIMGFIIGLPNVDIRGEYWIYQIAVNPVHRRKRIAENLLEEEIRKFKADGCKCIKARVLKYNDPSIELFTKANFMDFSRKGDWIELEKVIE